MYDPLPAAFPKSFSESLYKGHRRIFKSGTRILCLDILYTGIGVILCIPTAESEQIMNIHKPE